MKEVEFTIIETKKVLVHEMSEYLQYHHMQYADEFAIIRDSNEFIPEITKTESDEIHRVVVDGVESYFSVSRETWEKLALFENPVTVGSLIKERDKYENESNGWMCKFNKSQKEFKKLKQKIEKMSFFDRFKFMIFGRTNEG